MTWQERFESSYEPEPNTGCWIWIRYYTNDGYPSIQINKKGRRASQVSWELKHGRPFPVGLFACHKCDNPACVNPEHIWAGTRSENVQDSIRKGRFKGSRSRNNVCRRGHAFTPENTAYMGANRTCRQCYMAWKENKRKVG